MELFIQLLIAGLSLGGIYALLSFSFSLIISTTRVLNIAHGVFFLWGAAVFSILWLHIKLTFPIAFICMILFFTGLGLLFYWGIVRLLMSKDPHYLLSGSVLATFGLALAMESIMAAGWVAYINPQPTFLLPMDLPPLNFIGTMIPSNRLIVLVLGGVMILGFHLLLKKTFLGRSARAMAQNQEGFMVLGLNPQRVTMFMILTAILATALAGILYALVIPLDAYEGLPITLKALTVMILAGVGSLPGTMAAGVLLGLAEVIGAYYLGAIWAPMISFVLLFLVLLVRPTGLFGRVTI
ncbi:branched-chain amino acid ABC transporter permease [Thermodesulfobacteriota bacterium]